MTALRHGFTTGACAAAAAKAATLCLCRNERVTEVDIALPDGERVRFPVGEIMNEQDAARATVRKDAGDDPDVTHGALVEVTVAEAQDGKFSFAAGDGVGVVTKPGLAVPPGEPAINPAPRALIRRAVGEVTARPLRVTVAIPGGRELAAKTFNPRLGIVGGLSILGTTGRVRPYQVEALRETIRCAFSVARAAGIDAPVLTPGHIGCRAAQKYFSLAEEQAIEVGNEWGFALEQLRNWPARAALLVGHPGKLAKLAAGAWDTHSSRSASAVPWLLALARETLGLAPSEVTTVEGFFQALAEPLRQRLGEVLAERIHAEFMKKLAVRFPGAVMLINLQGERLGAAGDLTPWSP